MLLYPDCRGAMPDSAGPDSEQILNRQNTCINLPTTMSKQTLHYDTETKCSQNTNWNYMELYGTYMKSNGTNGKYWELTGTDRDKRNKITNK